MRLLPVKAHPFLKWAGGKSRLIEQFTSHLPPELKHGTIKRYVEPFIGGGALFLHLVHVYEVREYVLSDVHEELILCYRTLQQDVEAVIAAIETLQASYLRKDDAERERMFYAIREQFNAQRTSIDYGHFTPSWIERTAQILFLNHTCFNGLFRFNSRGEFNVPFGRYKHPRMYQAENLRIWSRILQETTILQGDFTICEKFADVGTFFYFDPPYRPLNKTAAFTGYARDAFREDDQQRLAAFFRRLDQTGAKLMLSNSNPRNVDPDDTFFDELYAGFTVSEVLAARAINSNGKKRGRISELVITNYDGSSQYCTLHPTPSTTSAPTYPLAGTSSNKLH
jgi:DNA adenine methylase